MADSDSDTEFFTRRPVARKVVPKAKAKPQTVGVIDISSGDDSDGSDSPKKKRRRKGKRPVKRTLPDWTRTSAEPRRRGGTEDRKTSAEPVSLLSSDDEENRSASPSQPRDKGKGKERERERHRTVTPPPEMTEKQQRELQEKIRAHYAEQRAHYAELRALAGEADDDALDTVPEGPEDADDADDPSESVAIIVRMVMDPERRRNASELAIKGYEKTRQFQVSKNEPLSTVINALADRVSKSPYDLLLEYNGKRLYALSQTPFYLGITDKANMFAYEKEVWERIQAAKRREALEILGEDEHPPSSPSHGTHASSSRPRAAPRGNGTAGDPLSLDSDDGSDSDPLPAQLVVPTGAPSAPIVIHAPDKVKVTLRGEQGEVKMGVLMTTKASTICRYYCNKFNLSGTLADTLRLVLDGEDVPPDSTVDDMDLEDGDLLDIH